MYKLSCLLILITLQLFQLCSSSDECSRQNKLKQIIRGNYKNVISYENGSLLTSWKQNIFNGSNQFIGVLLRNEIYDNIGDLKGTYCLIGGSITIRRLQLI